MRTMKRIMYNYTHILVIRKMVRRMGGGASHAATPELPIELPGCRVTGGNVRGKCEGPIWKGNDPQVCRKRWAWGTQARMIRVIGEMGKAPFAIDCCC